MASYLDANVHIAGMAYDTADVTSQTVIDQFVDPSTGLPRNPANGANFLNGSVTWEVLLANPSASYTTNSGAGGDPTGSNSGDATSPGTYAADYAGSNPGDIVLAAAYTRWKNSDPSNTITSGAVETWADLGSEGNAATQTTSTQRPVDNTSYADFDGTDDELNVASPGTKLLRPFRFGGTMAIVFNADTVGGTDRLYDHGLGEEVYLTNLSGGACDLQFQFRYQLASGQYKVTAGITIGAVTVLFIRFDKSTGSSSLKVNINSSTALTTSSGVTINTAPSGSVFAPDTALAIGGRKGLGGGNFNGKQMEVLFWDSILSDTDANDAGARLASIYSGTWS